MVQAILTAGKKKMGYCYQLPHPLHKEIKENFQLLVSFETKPQIVKWFAKMIRAVFSHLSFSTVTKPRVVAPLGCRAESRLSRLGFQHWGSGAISQKLRLLRDSPDQAQLSAPRTASFLSKPTSPPQREAVTGNSDRGAAHAAQRYSPRCLHFTTVPLLL